MAASAAATRDGEDAFDGLPDHLVLHILDLVGDARSLAGCRAVCRRLDALVPLSGRLLIQVDAVVPARPSSPRPLLPLLGQLLRSALLSLAGVVSPSPQSVPSPWKSPADVIRGFPRVRRLEIELPGGDLGLEKGAVVRWKAEFGGRLRRCAILAARRIVWGSGGEEAGEEVGGGIKERVIWTIGVLISASARHYVAREVVRARRRGSGGGGEEEVEEMEGVVVRDREGEGTLLMDKDGVRECVHGSGGEDEGRWARRRTAVPAVRMRMRWARRVEVGAGGRMEGAALVVVRAAEGGGGGGEEEEAEAERWAAGAFEGPFRRAAGELLKRPSHSLEMNSF